MPFSPQRPEDFFVEEVPAYLPSGEGGHCYLLIEKTGLTTLDAIGRLCALLGVRPERAGYAGMKDRFAVTRQWVSLEGVDPEQTADLDLAGVRVLKSALHGNRLRTGHLRGNRFRVTVRGAPDLQSAFDRLLVYGLPNRYGGQRFAADNVEQGRAIVRGDPAARRIDPRRRRMAVSALQSHAFNEVLAERDKRGLLREKIEGDVQEGGAATGPMPGYKMRRPADGSPARLLEDEVFGRLGIRCEDFRAVGKIGVGTRRPLVVSLQDAFVERPDEGTQVVHFQLPPGSYGTVVMEELGM